MVELQQIKTAAVWVQVMKTLKRTLLFSCYMQLRNEIILYTLLDILTLHIKKQYFLQTKHK